MKTLSGTDSRVIGMKFEELSLEPFLCIKMVHAFFHSEGTRPDSQTMRIISVKNFLKYGHRLKQIIEILSKGHGELEDLILRMA